MQEHRVISPKGGVIVNNYESIIIINSNLEEAAVKSTIEKITDLVNDIFKTIVMEAGKV